MPDSVLMSIRCMFQISDLGNITYLRDIRPCANAHKDPMNQPNTP